MTKQIFISYSKRDKDFAWKLADNLVRAGHKVWLDRSLVVGEDWEQTIIKKLEEADEVIVVLSSNAIASKWVQHEGSIAFGLKKKMYPVLIETLQAEELPLWVSKFQYHSFLNVDYEPAFHELTAALTPANPIQDLLEQQVLVYKQTGELMGKSILGVIHEAQENLILDLTAQELIEKSQLAIEKRQSYEKQLVTEKEVARQGEIEKAKQLANTERQRTVAFALGLFIAIGLGIYSAFLLRQSRQNLIAAQIANTQSAANAATAESQKARAEEQTLIAESRRLAALAQGAYWLDHYDLPALLSIEAIRTTTTAEAERALRDGVDSHLDAYYLTLPHDNVASIVLSSKSDLLVIAYCNRPDVGDDCPASTIEFWTLPQRQQIGSVEVAGKVLNLLLSPDEEILVGSVCITGSPVRYATHCRYETRVWDLHQKRTLSAPRIERDDYPISVGLTADGKTVLFGICKAVQIEMSDYTYISHCTKGEVRIWNIDSPPFAIQSISLLGYPYQFASHPTDQQVVAIGICNTDKEHPYRSDDYCVEGRIQLWNIKSMKLLASAEANSSINYFSFLNDRHLIVGTCQYLYSSSSEDCAVRVGTLSNDQKALDIRTLQNLPKNEHLVSAYCRGYHCGDHTSQDNQVVAITPYSIFTWWTSEQDYEKENILAEGLFDFAVTNYETGVVVSSQIFPQPNFLGFCVGPCPALKIAVRSIWADPPFWYSEENPYALRRERSSYDISDYLTLACDIAGRNLTQREWQDYFPGEEYRLTCPQWPAGE